MAIVFLRTLLIYFLLHVAMRFLGKRQLGELEMSELITTLMLSELAILPISDAEIPLAYAVIPILTLLALEVILSFFTARSAALRRMLFGAPSVLIRRGKLCRRELARLRIGIPELMAELRLKDVADISEVHCAILEDNGKLSVFLKSDTPGGAALPVIIAGKWMPSSLAEIGADETAIASQLKKRSLRVSDILLLTADETGHLSYIEMRSTDGRVREVDSK